MTPTPKPPEASADPAAEAGAADPDAEPAPSDAAEPEAHGRA
ncbi:MAG: hypothetical protein R3F14_37730 [Polyangiaceae bacterium]